MKIAIISDELTFEGLKLEPNVFLKPLSKYTSKSTLKKFKPDLLLVESAWKGYKNQWQKKICRINENPKFNRFFTLQRIIDHAKDIGIPTIFWNKEDSIHFDKFIAAAKMFDYVFTVDETCIPRYQKALAQNIPVNTLMFAVQTQIHSYSTFTPIKHQANFVGSYSHHIHPQRRKWQNMIFQAASDSELGLNIFDRNSNRKSKIYRYPKLLHSQILSSINYNQTAQIYKDHLISINVNTIIDSPTMFSRRLVETLACGCPTVTNGALSVEAMFKDYCHIIDSYDEAYELFRRIKLDGLNNNDIERAKAGAEYIVKNHTWKHRLEQIYSTVFHT